MSRDLRRQAPRISARLSKRLITVCERLGLDAAELCGRAGLTLEQLQDPHGRLALEQVLQLIEDVLERSQHPTLGLLLAEVAEPDAYHTPALILLASDTLRSGFERAFLYQRLWGDGDRFQLVPAAQVGRSEPGHAVTFRVPGRRRVACAVLEICALAETLLAVRALTQRFDERPLALGVPSISDDRAALEAHFGLPVETGRDPAFILFSESILEHPLPNANALFLSMFVQQASTELKTLPDADDLLGRVCAEITRGLAAGHYSLEACAKTLSLSARTLERRLLERGTSYVQLVERVRQNQALRLLGEQRSVEEVAVLLGYSERSAFHRACVRWFGRPPAALRGGLAAGLVKSASTDAAPLKRRP